MKELLDPTFTMEPLPRSRCPLLLFDNDRLLLDHDFGDLPNAEHHTPVVDAVELVVLFDICFDDGLVSEHSKLLHQQSELQGGISGSEGLTPALFTL